MENTIYMSGYNVIVAFKLNHAVVKGSLYNRSLTSWQEIETLIFLKSKINVKSKPFLFLS